MYANDDDKYDVTPYLDIWIDIKMLVYRPHIYLHMKVNISEGMRHLHSSQYIKIIFNLILLIIQQEQQLNKGIFTFKYVYYISIKCYFDIVCF
jgi:hypothetical protein